MTAGERLPVGNISRADHRVKMKALDYGIGIKEGALSGGILRVDKTVGGHTGQEVVAERRRVFYYANKSWFNGKWRDAVFCQSCFPF